MNNVTFVMPAFNASSTISEAVRSIFNGNFAEGDELIIVNDASTDDTAGISKYLSIEFAPAVVVMTNEQNKGCPASRNIGIAEAKNQLIFNLDADNLLVPGSIATLKAALVEAKAHIAAFATYHFFKDSPDRITHYWQCRPGPFTLADLLAGHINPGPGGNYLYTKASWESVGRYSEYGKGLHEAWGYSLKQLAVDHHLIVVKDTYYLHRHGHASLFSTESKNKSAEYELTKKMITPYRLLITEEDWLYIEHTPDWQEKLATRPLRLRDGSVGKNGTLIRTWYGLWQSLAHKLQSLRTH